MKEMKLRLPVLQRAAKEKGVPLIIVFEGWDAAGKGTIINELILPLDPRGFSVKSALPPTDEEMFHPFLWRYWNWIPAAGRITIFDRSWYRHVLNDRVDGLAGRSQLRQAYSDIISFERQLADSGYLILKFFLHISKDEQKRRFRKLRKSRSTAWRISKDDLKRHKQYRQYLAAADDMVAKTALEFAPWTIIEAHDRNYAAMKMFSAVISAIEKHLSQVPDKKPAPGAQDPRPRSKSLRTSLLDKVDLSGSMETSDYQESLKSRQKQLRKLEHEIYVRRIPVIIAYEGWDAAGKGGNIRRLTQMLDPRRYEVVPIAAPNDIEKAHHYLWRFWREMPKAGHIKIFDRSWYGRVLVERVEGFCSEKDWRRAYREINEMEEHLHHFGAVIVKFWLHIDQKEQLRRFKARQKEELKRWKITDEDWRNREKWTEYKVAVDEMLLLTSTPFAPWTVVPSNCKWKARVQCLETAINAIEKRMEDRK